MRHTVILSAVLCLLAGCVAGNDRFVGPVTGCGTNTRGLLDLRGTAFVFTPDQGVQQIHGTVDGTGKLQGSATEGPANARQPYKVQFDAARNGHTITGKLVRPDCTLDVALQER